MKLSTIELPLVQLRKLYFKIVISQFLHHAAAVCCSPQSGQSPYDGYGDLIFRSIPRDPEDVYSKATFFFFFFGKKKRKRKKEKSSFLNFYFLFLVKKI